MLFNRVKIYYDQDKKLKLYRHQENIYNLKKSIKKFMRNIWLTNKNLIRKSSHK